MKNILITGASGFVGSNLVKTLLKKSLKLHLMIHLGDMKNDNLYKIVKNNKNISVYELDLLEPDTLQSLPTTIDEVVYLAAQTDTSIRDHSVNSLGVKNFLANFKPEKHKTKFIYVGTMVNVAGRKSCKYTANESTEYFPSNEYTRTKVVGETYIKDYCHKLEIPLIILTPNTIYGTGMRKGSLFDMLTGFIKRKSFITRLNWQGKSALIHVDDVVKAITYFLNQKYPLSTMEKYFLYSENKTISELSILLHKKLNINYKPIILPAFIWKIIKFLRPYLYLSERILPAYLYNYIWRLSIIIDDCVFAESDKLKLVCGRWKPKLIKNHISDVV